MADTVINSRIRARYDTYTNWSTADPVLLKGELALVDLDVATDSDIVLAKVGDGNTPFSQLTWLSGLASDVYSWAKAATKPVYTLDEISGIDEYIINKLKDKSLSEISLSSTDGKITAPAYYLNSDKTAGLKLDTSNGDSVIVGSTSNASVVILAGGSERPYYMQGGNSSSFKELALKSDSTLVKANPSGSSTSTLSKVQIDSVVYDLSADVTKAKIVSALGYTPYDESNPRNFISSVTFDNVTKALGYTPYNSTNPNGYISEVTASDVTKALGYTPYNSTNPNGYITGISKTDVTAALGYKPYNSTNPNGYITSSVNNLTNYYTKSTIDNMVGVSLQTKIVTALPETNIMNNVIYLVPLSGTIEGYTQWMYIEGAWVKLGTTNINLSEYAKVADLSDVAKSGSYSSLLDKPVIPEDLADLTNSAGYVKADTTGLINYTKSSDLARVATTGSYNDLINKPSIPTNLSSLENDVNYITENDLSNVNISTFNNDISYAKLSDISALQELDVEAIKEAIAVTENVGTIKGVTAGSGLTGGGTTGTVTLSHSNVVTAKTSYGSTATSVTSGGSFTVTDIKYDSNGHITGSQDRSITIPEIPDITGMLTTSNYASTLDSVYQAKGNYQAAGDYLGPTNVVNDSTGDYVVNVSQNTRGQIAVTKGTLPTIVVIEDTNPTDPTTDTVSVVTNLTSRNHSITQTNVNVVTKQYVDNMIGDINTILDNINGEVI